MAVKLPKMREITSTEDLIRLLRPRHGNPKLLFRGQNVDKPLLPKIARNRQTANAELEKLERQMLERFKKEAHNFLTIPPPETDWNWLSIAQHQGLPTRLLDWTANALAGLWFAVSAELPENSDHAVLWVLCVEPEHLKSPSPNQNIFELRRTYVFQPYHVDRRIAAQSGWFSVHKYSEGSGKFIPLDRNVAYKKLLSKYVIPKNAVEGIRRELRLLGVSHATMFPDLAGLCAALQAEFLPIKPDIETI